jgi:hypothetical protein
MADENPYVQFDNLRTAPPPQVDDSGDSARNIPREAKAGDNPYAQFDNLRGDNPAGRSPTMKSVALQVPTGFNEATADAIGAPVDATTWLLNRIPGVEIKKPFLGSQSIKDAMGVIGANPDNAPAQNAVERVARGTGGGIASMVVPEAVVGTMGKVGAIAPEAVETLGRVFGQSAGPGDVAKAATVGAAAGGTGETAAELSPPQFAPAARVAGTLVGGGVGALAAETPRLAVEAGRGLKDFAAPMSAAGQEATAGKTLAQRATSPSDVIDTLDSRAPDLIPGSKPTTFQATGDMGLGALEREVQTQKPGDFQQRRAEQNTARVDALSGIQPTGSPQDVSAALRRQLGDIDQTTNQAIERATADAQAHAAGIGGTAPPEQQGSTLRGVLQDAEDTARKHEGNLWKAVDPDGKLAVSMGPVQEAAQHVYGSLTAAARSGLAPTERTVLDVMGTYKPVEPFKELSDLRSAVSSAMRNELVTSGRSPAYGRLSQLRGGIEGAISSAVEHQVAQEAHAVARGELSDEQTAAARLSAQRDTWYEQRRASAAGVGQSVAGNAGTNAAGGPRGISAVPGGQGKSRSGLRYDEGNSGLQGDVPLTPNFDQAAKERLNDATAATRERAQTYNQGPVGQVLRTQGQRGNYRSLDASVPATIFKPGPGGFETVQAFRKAVGDDHAATAMLQDTAAASLRQSAWRQDGVLDPAKFAAWKKSHADALRAVPGDLESRFTTAGNATAAIDHVAAIRRDALETYQRGAIGKLVGVSDPQDITRIVGGIFAQKDSVGAMRQLATEARADPAAVEGLRKSVADYMYGRFISNAEAATSDRSLMKPDAFQTFVRQNEATLKEVLSAKEVNLLKAIAADLRRSNRSLSAIKIPGQSNTAQDALPQLTKAMEHGSGSLFMQIIAAAGGGFAVHGLAGAATGITGVLGKNVIGKMREAGMEKVSDLIKQAMLDPDLARYLLAKAPTKPGTGSSVSLAQQLRRLSMYAPTRANTSNPRGDNAGR